MTAKALPMSRTKCVLSGPVSGTAAGSVAYQPAGSAGIHAALPTFSAPDTTSAHHQNPLRSPDGIAPPPPGPAALPTGTARAAGAGPPRPLPAHDRTPP